MITQGSGQQLGKNV